MLVRYICGRTTKFANVYFEPRNIVCTARSGTASGMSVNFSAIMEVGNIEREKNHSTNDIYRSITSTSSFWSNENSY